MMLNGAHRNPAGRSGMAERVPLRRWGPNHAADAIVTRYEIIARGIKLYDPSAPAEWIKINSATTKGNG